MQNGGDKQYWNPGDENQQIFPNNSPPPQPASQQPVNSPPPQVEQQIASQLNQQENAQIAAEQRAAQINPEAPLPGSGVRVSEPTVEEIPTRTGDVEAIHWTASESVDYKRNVWWYVIAGLITAAVVGVTIWLKLWTTAILAVVIFVAVVILVRRPARMVNYTLTSQGLYIEDKLHSFNEFRAFGVRQEGALWTLVLIPVKRFGLSVTMFINEEQGEAIVDAFGTVLPMENVQPDLVDRITRKLKF